MTVKSLARKLDRILHGLDTKPPCRHDPSEVSTILADACLNILTTQQREALMADIIDGAKGRPRVVGYTSLGCRL